MILVRAIADVQPILKEIAGVLEQSAEPTDELSVSSSLVLRALSLCQTEEALGSRHISEDLRLQCFRGRPLHLSPQPEKEFQIERRVVEQINRLEIQNVCFHSESHALKGGAVPEVGHSLEATIANGQLRHVDAESRKQAIVGR